MRVVLLSVCVAVSMSGCAPPLATSAPSVQIIEDQGWTSKTVVKAAEADAETKPAAKQRKAAAARKSTTSKSSRQAKAASTPAPSAVGAGGGADTRDYLAGACSKLARANCASGCTWVEVAVAGKAEAEGYCTAARSF